MIFQPHKHIITSKEINEAKKIGLELINCGSQPEGLLNQHFSNFELLTVFSGLSEITPLCQNLNSIHLVLNLSDKLELCVQYYTDDVMDESLGVGFSRIFSNKDNELTVQHDFFRLPKAHRGKGIAKEVIKLCLQQYVNMGVQKILIHAALTNGGYTWALYNFTVTEKPEIDVILEKAKQMIQPPQFSIIKKIYDNYYNQYPDGKAFPIAKWAEISFMKSVLTGCHWHGEIDLNNQEQFNNFILYAFS
jgi:hypothetical protein